MILTEDKLIGFSKSTRRETLVLGKLRINLQFTY